MLYVSLRQLEYVVAIARAGSMKAAADALHVSQPSLTVALNKVEDHLGQCLFLRTQGKSLSITTYGQNFVARAQALLDEAADLTKGGAGQSDQLVIGFFTDLAPRWIGPVLRALAEALPSVRLDHRIGDFSTIARDLEGGVLDLAITYDIGLDARFIKHPWKRVQPSAFLAEGHPLATTRDIALADLSGQPLILSDEGLSAQHFLNRFHAAGLSPIVRHRTRALEVMRALAANGEGIGLSYTTPPSKAAYDGKRLISRPIRDTSCEEAILLALMPQQQSNPALARAVQALTQVVSDGHLDD